MGAEDAEEVGELGGRVDQGQDGEGVERRGDFDQQFGRKGRQWEYAGGSDEGHCCVCGGGGVSQ